MKQNLIPCEKLVDLLQRQVLGLGIEEIDEWDEKRIENCRIRISSNPRGRERTNLPAK